MAQVWGVGLCQIWHKHFTIMRARSHSRGVLVPNLAQTRSGITLGWHSFGTNFWHKFWHRFGTRLAQVWHKFWHKILLTLLAILLTLLANFTNTFGFSKVSEFVRTSSQFQILLTLLANFTNTFGYFTNTFGYFTNNFGSRLEPKI